MNEWIDARRVIERINQWTNKWMNCWMNVWINERMDGGWINTFIRLIFVFDLISPVFSLVANPTAQEPFLGYSTKTTLFLLPFWFLKDSVIWPIAEYIVLKIGILLKRSSIICKNFLPKKDKERPPTIVIKITVKIISTPGIA